MVLAVIGEYTRVIGSKCCLTISSKPYIDIYFEWITYGKRVPFCLNIVNIVEFDGNFKALTRGLAAGFAFGIMKG